MPIEIPDTELMAEKLGMIVLCDNCGERLERCYPVRIPTWRHTRTKEYFCSTTESFGSHATARLGPLAIQYEMEPR